MKCYVPSIVIRNVEYKDGCVFMTQALGTVWIALSECHQGLIAEEAIKIAKHFGGDSLGSIPTNRIYQWLRREDIPSEDMVWDAE